VDFRRFPVGPGDRLLDLGCGAGRHAFEAYRRGADVVAFDADHGELCQVSGMTAAMAATGEVPPAARAQPVGGDATAMPFGDGSFDRVIAAEVLEHVPADQRALAEIARVLRPGGYWAAWWNRPRADGMPWFERYQDVLVANCPGYTWRDLRDETMAPDWSAPAVRGVAALDPALPVFVPWTRHITANQWLTDERSKSYIIGLDPARRESVLAELAAVVAAEFPAGQMVVPYVTTLLMARKAA
jgi:SAM-dependent methyltransferase